MFFGGEVISSHDPDLEIDTLATDPTRDEVRTLLAAEDPEGFEEAVAALGVKYILLLDMADIDQYDFLTERSELTVVVESSEVTVFHNEAFANAPPPDAWPANGSELPLMPVLGGSRLSLGRSSSSCLNNRHLDCYMGPSREERAFGIRSRHRPVHPVTAGGLAVRSESLRFPIDH